MTETVPRMLNYPAGKNGGRCLAALLSAWLIAFFAIYKYSQQYARRSALLLQLYIAGLTTEKLSSTGTSGRK